MAENERRIDVFVSSTSKDLGAFRNAVRNVLIDRKMLPIMMEDFPAISRDATELCKAKVHEAELFIGVYAYRYGYCPNNGNVGITEMEYEWAAEQGIERLLFVIDPSVKWPDDSPIRKFADDDPRLDAFQDRVGKQLVWKTFTSPEDLALKVEQALVAWEQGPENIATRGRIPRMALYGLIALIMVTLLLHATTLEHFVSAGQPIVALLGAVLGLALVVVPLWLTSLQPVQQSIKRPWIAALVLQVLAFLLILLGRGPLLTVLGQQELSSALSMSDTNTARRQLSTAIDMGVNVAAPLGQELTASLDAPVDPGNDDRSIRLAMLYTGIVAAGNPQRSKIAVDVNTRAQDAAMKVQGKLTLRLANVLAVLDSAQAVVLANEFNDAGIKAEDQTPPNLAQAQVYLDVVRSLDNRIDTGRSNQVKSISRYNLAYLHELLGDPDGAILLYRESLALDDSNLDTRYALSSLLLLRADQDPKGLDEAIDLASKGVKNYIDPSLCIGPQNLADDTIFTKVWNCFILQTTEAGARLKRHNLNASDTPRLIETLARKAILLAQANDQFRSRPGYYTAEAYYYLARVTEPQTDQDTLCQIILNHNSDSQRQRDWVGYANQQLGTRTCGPH